MGKIKNTCNQVCFRQTNLKGNVHAYEVIFNVHHKTPASLADAFAQVEALQLVIVSGICDMKKKRDVKNIKRKQSNFVSPSPEKRQRINDIEESYDVLIEQPEPEPQAEPEHILKLKLGRPVDMDPQQLRRDKLKLQKINFTLREKLKQCKAKLAAFEEKLNPPIVALSDEEKRKAEMNKNSDCLVTAVKSIGMFKDKGGRKH